jgi:hypothetical protein
MLATIDAAFCGYRAAAGRSALIHKKSYYRRAMLRGALYGQAAVVLVGVLLAILLFFSQGRAGLIEDLLTAGECMLFVYLPYAIIILIAFAFRCLPSVDVRSLMSVLIFGPLTLARPFVAVAGVAWGIIATRRIEVIVVGTLALLLMLCLEPLLGWMKVYAPVYKEV